MGTFLARGGPSPLYLYLLPLRKTSLSPGENSHWSESFWATTFFWSIRFYQQSCLCLRCSWNQKSCMGIPGGLVVSTLCFYCQGPAIRELRSHKPCGVAPKIKKIKFYLKKKKRNVLDPPRLDFTWSSAANFNFNSIQQKWFAGILFRRTGISKTRCLHGTPPPIPLASGWVWGWPGAAPEPMTITRPLLLMLSLFML